jgi:molecular chaperone DnaK (HSP70)
MVSSMGVSDIVSSMIIANDQGNRITPSYVSWIPEDERLIGDAAKNQATINPERTVFDVRRLIGRKFKDRTVQHDVKLFPFKVVSKDSKPYIQMSIEGKDKQFAPEEISAMVLQKMKLIAEKFLGGSLGHGFTDGSLRHSFINGSLRYGFINESLRHSLINWYGSLDRNILTQEDLK